MDNSCLVPYTGENDSGHLTIALIDTARINQRPEPNECQDNSNGLGRLEVFHESCYFFLCSLWHVAPHTSFPAFRALCSPSKNSSHRGPKHLRYFTNVLESRFKSQPRTKRSMPVPDPIESHDWTCGLHVADQHKESL